jgi:hypothetical protein
MICRELVPLWTRLRPWKRKAKAMPARQMARPRAAAHLKLRTQRKREEANAPAVWSCRVRAIALWINQLILLG